MMQITKNTFKITLTVIALASLSACGGGKKVVTADDSAEYKNATSLQPLKRPDSKKNVLSTQPVVTPDVKIEENQDVGVVANKSVDKASVGADANQSSVVQDGDSFASNNVSSKIITSSNGATRLEINADFKSAWEHLNNKLKTSDLTVFSRNKSAGRFSIGCGGIEADSGVVKKSGWSFLNRDKGEILEYCALELLEKRGLSYVSVLNRSGVEVATDFSKPIFQRILSN